MKTLLFSVTILFWTAKVYGQVKFTHFETGIIHSNNVHFGGISGIENLGGNNWVLVSDRGYYFKCDNCFTISDFQQKIKQNDGTKTDHWFESIRFNPNTNIFFYSTEYETNDPAHLERSDVYLSTVASTSEKITKGESLILQIDSLPIKNKGIEAITLTPSGALWIAPEAGWKGETAMTQNYMSFYRYNDPILSREKQEFKYPIRRFPEAHFSEDKSGGISEILAIDETHLLILERCYVKYPQDHVIVLLRNVTVDEQRHELTIDQEDAYDFTTIPYLCNVEGMAWGDDNKNTLYIVADDGVGTFYNNSNEKPTLKNQLIILYRD